MNYTEQTFKDWLAAIPAKLKIVTEEFAKEEGLKLDFSIESLDELEKWILKNYDEAADLREDTEMLDLLSLYIGETFIRLVNGDWFVELENKKSLLYQNIVVKFKDEDGDTDYRSTRVLCTTCITRKKGNVISSTFRKILAS